MDAQAAPPETTQRFIRIRQVLDRVPVSRTSIYRMMDRGEFPKNVTFGSTSAWVESEIEAWVAEKVAAR